MPGRELQNLSVPVAMRTERGTFEGALAVPDTPSGLIVLVHDRDAGRTTRDRAVAAALGHDGFATLELERPARHQALGERAAADPDADLAAATDRLAAVVGWVQRQDRLAILPLGLFAAGAGAAAALRVAALVPTV